MIYTIVYKQEESFGTFTFASKHDKNLAWYDFINNYAEEEQTPVAICPGNVVIYFNDCISPEENL